MLEYAVLTTLYWAAFYGLYVLALRRHTFFRLNRSYLLAALAAGLILPLLDGMQWPRPETAEAQAFYVAPVVAGFDAINTWEAVITAAPAGKFIFDCMFEKGWSVFILSTRDPVQIKEWLESVLFLGKELPFKITILPPEQKFWNEKKNIGITNRKLAAHVYIDDRGFRFEGHFDGMIEQLEIFKTWQNK